MSDTKRPPSVHLREQEFGTVGVNFSLMSVAEFIRESRLDVLVVAVGRQIVKAAGYPTEDLEICRAVWNWIREKGIAWLRDPAHAEFMAHARHFLTEADARGEKNDGALFCAGDCDELTILILSLFLACCEAVGVENAAVLGHSYRGDKMISHVLAAIHDGKQWHRIDLSGDWGFGEFKDPTWEKMIAVPSCREICDAPVCASGPRAVRPPLNDQKGDFVGVSGLPMDQKKIAFVSLGDPDNVSNEAAAWWNARCNNNAEHVDSVLEDLDDAHAKMLGVFSVLEIDPVSKGWGPDEEASYSELRKAGVFLAQVFREAGSGKRKIAVFPDSDEFAIGALDSDAMALSFDDDVVTLVRSLSLNIEDGAIVSAEVTGLGAAPVGLIVVVAGIVGVALVAAGYYGLVRACDALRDYQREKTQQAITERAAECTAEYNPERCAALAKATGEASASRDVEDRKKAEAQAETAKAKASQAKWITIGGTSLVVLTVAGVWWAKKKGVKFALRKAA